jgi:putative Ca2+/H+ antiporter (TMEM165/GDT1 family)
MVNGRIAAVLGALVGLAVATVMGVLSGLVTAALLSLRRARRRPPGKNTNAELTLS